jgi:hypothetical protein
MYSTLRPGANTVTFNEFPDTRTESVESQMSKVLTVLNLQKTACGGRNERQLPWHAEWFHYKFRRGGEERIKEERTMKLRKERNKETG